MFLVSQLSGFGSGNQVTLPSQISGLQFWVKSDTGVTKDGSNNVSSWADQSGNGRDVAEATNQPLWVDATVNGKPVIRFDGTNDRLVSSSSFVISQPYHLFAVFNIIASPAAASIVHFDNDAGGVNPAKLQYTTTPVLRIQANGLETPNISISTGTWYLAEGLWNGTSSTCTVNAGSASGDADDLTIATDGISLGARFSDQFANVDIAEVAFFNAAITGNNLTGLREYFRDRYAIF